jgi:hypothetical protein
VFSTAFAGASATGVGDGSGAATVIELPHTEQNLLVTGTAA